MSKMTLDLIDSVIEQVAMQDVPTDATMLIGCDQYFSLLIENHSWFARMRRKYIGLNFEELKIAIKVYSPPPNGETHHD